MRLTKFDRMRNDPEEGIYVVRLYKQAIEELGSDGKIGEERSQMLERIASENLDVHTCIRGTSVCPVPCTPYVICFSKDFIPEPVWDEYGDEQGVALRYHPDLNLLINSLPAGIRGPSRFYFDMFEVKYDRRETIEKLKECISEVIDKFDRDEIIESTIRGALVTLHLFVKAEEWRDEKEIRLVYYMPENFETDEVARKCICEKCWVKDADSGTWKCRNYGECDKNHVWIDSKCLLSGAIIRDGHAETRRSFKVPNGHFTLGFQSEYRKLYRGL